MSYAPTAKVRDARAEYPTTLAGEGCIGAWEIPSDLGWFVFWALVGIHVVAWSVVVIPLALLAALFQRRKRG
jgi:hypothetical protein